MASQALYRRYRSQTFSELVGQEHIVQTLRNALAEGRIAHAYLFTGPRGVGKTTVARLLAKAVNCTAPEDQRPCGVCDSCVSVADGRAVDVIEMDAASHTSVEDAREIIERVQFRPSNGAYKVYIIDEVHMLSTAAFNALLKTLEEPPGHALFILATTESHKVPATILSRCQRFTFNRHTVAAITAHLQEIAAQEGFTLESGAAEALSRAATGSMRDALSVLDQLMAYGSSTITVEQVQNLLGATQAQEVAALVAALIENDLTGALQAVAGVTDQGADLRQYTRDVVERLRALMLLKAGGDASLIDATAEELQTLEVQAQDADLGVLLRWIKLFSSLDVQIRTAAIPQLPLEMAVVEALAVPVPQAAATAIAPQPRPTQRATATHPPSRATPPPAPVREQPAAPAPVREQPAAPAPVREQPAAPAPVREQPAAHVEAAAPPPMPEPPPSEEPPHPADLEHGPADSSDEAAAPAPALGRHSEAIQSENAAVAALEQIEQIWPAVVRDVRIYNKTLQALLNSGVRPVDVQDNMVVLEVVNDWLPGRIEKEDHRRIIEQVLSKLTGINYGIRCVVEAQRRENPNVLREQIRNSRKDPLVKAAINIFDADIVAVENEES